MCADHSGGVMRQGECSVENEVKTVGGTKESDFRKGLAVKQKREHSRVVSLCRGETKHGGYHGHVASTAQAAVCLS